MLRWCVYGPFWELRLADLYLQDVSSSNEGLRKRIESVVDMALTTVSSLSESFKSVASTLNTEEPKGGKAVEDVGEKVEEDL